MDKQRFAIQFAALGNLTNELEFVPDVIPGNHEFLGGAMSEQLSLSDWEVVKFEAVPSSQSSFLLLPLSSDVTAGIDRHDVLHSVLGRSNQRRNSNRRSDKLHTDSYCISLCACGLASPPSVHDTHGLLFARQYTVGVHDPDRGDYYVRSGPQ